MTACPATLVVMTDLTPFTVAIPQDDLDDLHRRLAAVRLPDAPGGIDRSHGVELGHLTELVPRWACSRSPRSGISGRP